MKYMNFSYLDTFPKFKKLQEYCQEAEEFAITKPNISATSARKAMEFIVKFIYLAEVPYANSGLTVFEMISDPLFKDYINDWRKSWKWHSRYLSSLGE